MDRAGAGAGGGAGGGGGADVVLGDHDPGDAGACAPDEASLRRAMREKATSTMPAITLQAMDR